MAADPPAALAGLAMPGGAPDNRPRVDQSDFEAFCSVRGMLLSRLPLPWACQAVFLLLAGAAWRPGARDHGRLGPAFCGHRSLPTVFLRLCLSHVEGSSARLLEEDLKQQNLEHSVLPKRTGRGDPAAVAGEPGLSLLLATAVHSRCKEP